MPLDCATIRTTSLFAPGLAGPESGEQTVTYTSLLDCPPFSRIRFAWAGGNNVELDELIQQH
jgi:hypothetical protein